MSFSARDAHKKCELPSVYTGTRSNNPDLPDIEESRWKLSGEAIEYDWIKGNLIVPNSCMTYCAIRMLRYMMISRMTVLLGDELTNMLDEVFEIEPDEED